MWGGGRTLSSWAVLPRGIGRGRVVTNDFGSKLLEGLAPGFDEDVYIVGLFNGGEGDEYDFGMRR